MTTHAAVHRPRFLLASAAALALLLFIAGLVLEWRTDARSTDGRSSEGVSAFDDTAPTVTRLDPDLRRALRRAARDAASEQITLVVSSGWRSRAEQERLLAEAVARYGSEAEARRWVATPQTSRHVSGDAVDVAPARAARWLAEHGAAHGLCQVYANEPWHFELRPKAVRHGCPRMFTDPTADPRLHQ